MREDGFLEGDLVITRTSNFGDIDVFVHPIIQNKDSVKTHVTELAKALEFCKHYNLSTIVINFDEVELPPQKHDTFIEQSVSLIKQSMIIQPSLENDKTKRTQILMSKSEQLEKSVENTFFNNF